MQTQTQWPAVADKFLEILRQAGVTVTDGLREAVRQFAELGPEVWAALVLRERVFAGVALLVLFLLLAAWLLLSRRWREMSDDSAAGFLAAGIGLGIAAVCFLPFLVARLVAPEAYVLEEVLLPFVKALR